MSRVTAKKTITLFCCALLLFFLGALLGPILLSVGQEISHRMAYRFNAFNEKWPEGFLAVHIKSSVDSQHQRAYFLPARGSVPKPLVISLHQWDGNFSQPDPLAGLVEKANWNYIHPDFRGPNWKPEACLSAKVLSDIDDSIQYALDTGQVDPDNIFIVGKSGGGYAALGVYLTTKFKIKCFYAWVPISDLSAWYRQSAARSNPYAGHILKCTGSGFRLDEISARSRSPLYWPVPERPNGRLEIYAGLNDGYSGCVPVSHAILFYNHVVNKYKKDQEAVQSEDMVKLLTREVAFKNKKIGDRRVAYAKDAGFIALTIFDGGHEMLPHYCFNRMKLAVASR